MGIPNYGNTCFLNSISQLLKRVNPFTKKLEKIDCKKDDLCKNLKRIIISKDSQETTIVAVLSNLNYDWGM